MTMLHFVPGLQGHLNVGTDIPNPESNRAAAERAAARLKMDFQTVSYQSLSNPFPKLSRMGQTLALGFTKRGGESLCVAASVGFGVFMQSLRNLFSVAATPPHVIGIMGVPDPLTAIELQVQNMAPQDVPLMNAIKAGSEDVLPLPLLKNDFGPEPGHFKLTHEHFADRDALRLIANPANRQVLTNLVDDAHVRGNNLDWMKVPSMLLITSKDDPFYRMNLAFKEIAQPWVTRQIEVREVTGGHGVARAGEIENIIVEHGRYLGL